MKGRHAYHMTGHMTHRGGVDEDDNDHNQQDQDDAPNDVPLVVAPDNELEGLPGRREPQE